MQKADERREDIEGKSEKGESEGRREKDAHGGEKAEGKEKPEGRI